jgi:hypothetical protein
MANDSSDLSPQAKAHRRAELIIQVRAGRMTAVAAAAALGVSRKTWYEWEERGLAAMAEALADRPTGRPASPPPDPEKTALERQVRALEKQVQQLQTRDRIRDLFEKDFLPVPSPSPQGPAPPASKKGASGRKPS